MIHGKTHWRFISGHRLLLVNKMTLDIITPALAASLPWSTSATLILAMAWSAVRLTTISFSDLADELHRPRSYLPVLFALFGLAGMFWAPVDLSERLGGLSGFYRFFLIPVLIVHFRDHAAARSALLAFLFSCVAMLCLSTATKLYPALSWWRDYPGVPFKNADTQSFEFGLCLFGLLLYAIDRLRAGRDLLAILSLIVACGFLVNILYVATSRTELIAIIIISVFLLFNVLNFRSAVLGLVMLAFLSVVVWNSSTYLRERITHGFWEFDRYENFDQGTSIGARIEFAKRSIYIITQAPLFGHGTGSIKNAFSNTAASGPQWVAGTNRGVGQQVARTMVTENPHNQTFTVAIQLGALGAAILYAMWLAHFLNFRGSTAAHRIGQIFVLQYVAGSAFNSLLSDFTEGWLYVLGIGILAGSLPHYKLDVRNGKIDS